MDSILTTTKKVLGIDEEYTHFDVDILMHINSAFSFLNQLGIGPDEGFRIVDKDDSWQMFFGSDIDFESVKTYIYLRVRLLFDPPQASHARDAFVKQYQEIEWRLQVQREAHVYDNR